MAPTVSQKAAQLVFLMDLWLERTLAETLAELMDERVDYSVETWVLNLGFWSEH